MNRSLATLIIAGTLAMLCCTAAAQVGDKATPTGESSSLRLISPKPGEKLTSNIVEVQYELTQPAAASGTPNFQLRLDAQDPIRTTSTTHTFTSLASGNHTLTVELVDANDTPIAGSRLEVRFVVVSPPPQRPGGAASAGTSAPLRNASLRQEDRGLPRTGSSLPLLSVIGMGVLVGGLISAMKSTR